MSKLFAACLFAFVAVGCSRKPVIENNWNAEVHEFSTYEFWSIEGLHTLVVSADKPVKCTIYRNGAPVATTESQVDNVCHLEYRTYDKEETLKFYIMYKDSKTDFKYHASLI